MENKYIRFCDICSKTKSDTNKTNIEKDESDFYKGYLIAWDVPDSDICPICNQGHLINSNMTTDELMLLGEVSDYNRDFLDAMLKLKSENIIEYQLKMSQFKNQLSQQEEQSSQKTEENKPKCPTCNSTNIEKISLSRKAVGGLAFGLFSSNVRKTMHCKNCGYKW